MDNSEQAIEASIVVLEKLVDTHSLAYLIEMLSRICHEKADHIRASYDDEPLARSWDKDANTLSDLASKIEG